MRFLLSFFLIFTINAAEFKSYEAEFNFETKFGNFPLKRYFDVEGNQINTKVKLEVLWFKYSLDSNFKIENNMRIAQMVVCPVTLAEVCEVDKLDETERGKGGFGSTGK